MIRGTPLKPVDEDDEPILETRLRPVTFTYLEKLNPLSVGAEVEEDGEGEIDSDEEDDLFRYLFMGAQQWLVFVDSDPGHNFRKEVRFRMENSFAAESLRKKERSLKRIEGGLPDIDSAAYKDFKNKKNKKIMKDYNFKNVSIVSDPYHTRRIQILADLFDFEKVGIELNIVGSDLSWWNKSTYYKEEKAIEVAFSELIKIPYNFIKYGLLYTKENL